jgi:peptidoglycan lytic transglycosylase
MRSSLRAPFLKALLVGGALAASVAFVQDEAGAEPVVSSWYGPGFEGAMTASGEPFDPYGHTAASPYLPFGTRLYVCYQGCVTVRVNDRGPYGGGREMDLSQAAAEAIGLTYVGVDVVDATVLGYGPS